MAQSARSGEMWPGSKLSLGSRMTPAMIGVNHTEHCHLHRVNTVDV